MVPSRSTSRHLNAQPCCPCSRRAHPPRRLKAYLVEAVLLLQHKGAVCRPGQAEEQRNAGEEQHPHNRLPDLATGQRRRPSLQERARQRPATGQKTPEQERAVQRRVVGAVRKAEGPLVEVIGLLLLEAGRVRSIEVCYLRLPVARTRSSCSCGALCRRACTLQAASAPPTCAGGLGSRRARRCRTSR